MLSLNVILTLLLTQAGIAAEAKNCAYLQSGRELRKPVSISCVDQGTVGFLAPGIGDFTHRTVYLGSPSFVSATENEDWSRSALSRVNANSFRKIAPTAESVKALRLSELKEAAAPRTASSRQELDRIVQARCVLFASSNICANAVESGQVISCSGSAESISRAGSDQTSHQEKLRILLSVGKEIGVERLTFAAFMAVLKVVSPSLAESAKYAIRGYYLFRAGDETYRDMRDVLEAEKTNWFRAFLKAQENRNMEQYCYAGSEQFKVNLKAALILAVKVYKAQPKSPGK